MVRCPARNNLNDEKVKFCEVCGASLYSDARDRKVLSEGKAKRKTKKFLHEEVLLFNGGGRGKTIWRFPREMPLTRVK
jgi:hypothetical protein